MVQPILFLCRLWQRNRYRWILALSWFCGFICGFFVYSSATEVLPPLMRAVPGSSASVLSMFFTAGVLLCLTAYFSWCENVEPLYFLCFCNAFLLSFLSLGLRHSFSEGGWLLSLVLLADRWLISWIMYIVWLRLLVAPRSMGRMQFVFLLCMLLLCESIYYCVITPQLTYLIIT